MSQVAPGQGTDLRARGTRLFKFGLVGLSGYVVNTAALALFTDLMGIHYLIGATLATQASTTWNYFFTDAWVFGARTSSRGQVSRFTMFWAMNNSTLVVRLPLMWVMTSLFGIHHLISNVVSLGIVTVLRFWASDAFIWRVAR